MICATGDLHGNALRFQPEYFPEQAEMTKDDYYYFTVITIIYLTGK